MTDSNQQPRLSKEEIDSVIALYSNGQYQEAINQIKVLNEAYPNVPLLFNLVGACYKALGQLEGSAKMFETAVNINNCDFARVITIIPELKKNRYRNKFPTLGSEDITLPLSVLPVVLYRGYTGVQDRGGIEREGES